jgi:pyrroloquinoline-quinone synthase
MRTYIRDLEKRLAPAAHPYLTALAEGSLSRDDFIETQIQFFFAVAFFPRPMASLAGRLPRPAMRSALLDNLRDEHGDGNLDMSHERTFLRHLSGFGVTPAEVERRALWPEVRIFNTALAGLCALDDWRTGVAALGMIEQLFGDISATIGRAMVQRGFLQASEVAHYSVHAQIDARHAEGFFALLDAPYAESPEQRYLIEQGLELGGELLLGLYHGLFRGRARRWMRPTGGSHGPLGGWEP